MALIKACVIINLLLILTTFTLNSDQPSIHNSNSTEEIKSIMDGPSSEECECSCTSLNKEIAALKSDFVTLNSKMDDVTKKIDQVIHDRFISIIQDVIDLMEMTDALDEQDDAFLKLKEKLVKTQEDTISQLKMNNRDYKKKIIKRFFNRLMNQTEGKKS